MAVAPSLTRELRSMKIPYYSLLPVNLSILLLLTCCLLTSGQKLYGQDNREANSSSFRYVIIENRLDEDANPGEKRRVVEVLLDRRAFSEKNLRILFQLVSKRFADDDLLDVWVHTSLEQAPTPEERDAGATSEDPDESTKHFYWAWYLRSSDDEFFRYSPRNDKSGNRLIQLKSKGP